jgi:nitrogen-specific signal transduction histidine kinase
MAAGLVVLIVKVRKFNMAASKQRLALTKLREAYKDLETTKPLREIGQSVAFINHELKNYMMVISGYTSLLQRSKNLNDKDREMINSIAEVAVKLQNLSLSIIEMSRARAMHEDREFNLMETLSSCTNSSFQEKPSGFSLRCDVPQNIVMVNGSPEKLARAFQNAFDNSLEAGAQSVDVRLSVYNYMALVVIEDDGAGCDAAHFKDISTTFFTTKPAADGIGLGLCVMRSIVEAHSGNVSVYSKNLLGGDARGLSVQIVIPASKKMLYAPAKSEAMLVTDGFDDTSGILKILKNLKIIPHIAETLKGVDFDSRSAALDLVVLAAPRQAAELRTKAGDNTSVKVLAIETGEDGALFVCDGKDGNCRDLFTEDYIVRSLCDYSDE